MPTWPIEIPSDTLIVPNSSGYPPAACTPSLTALASRSSDRLHGVISFQLDATPICGFAQSVVTHTDRAEHAAGRGRLQPVGDGAAAGLDVR